MATNEELHEDPTAEMLRRLTDQTSTLIRQEMELARVELQEAPPPSPPRRGSGPTALFGLGATGAFVAGVILALATVIEAWIAAFAVACVLALLAVVSAAAAGRREGPAIEAPRERREDAIDEQSTSEEDAVREPLGADLEPESELIAVYAQDRNSDAPQSPDALQNSKDREDDFSA